MKEVTIEDKVVFDSFPICTIMNSEYQFTTIFAWSKTYHFQYLIHNSFLIVFGQQKNGAMQCYFPIGHGDFEECINYIMNCFALKGQNINFRPLSEKMVNILKPYLPKDTEFATKESYSDYIYQFQDLLLFKGKKYKRKRKQINFFKKNYCFQYKTISPQNSAEYLSALIRILNLENTIDQDEINAYSRLLQNFEKLNLRGGAIYINNIVEGIAVGEKINNQVIIHIRRCNKSYLGIYPTILNLLLNNEFLNSNCVYVNCQDDLGDIGLRQSKLSYKPNIILEKYYALRRTQ